MSTPDQLADDINNNVAHSIEIDGSLYVSVDATVAYLRSIADQAAAKATALFNAQTAHRAQATVAHDDLIDTANMVRDLHIADTWTPRFPGDTRPGTIRLGVTYGSNTEPGDRYNAPLGCRRTFASTWAGRNNLIGYAKADHAADRLPFISTKIDVPKCAAGDATILRELEQFIESLDELGQPVVLGVYHEPEDNIRNGEFTAAQWRIVQVRVREAISDVGASNIAFATPLMSWTWNPASGRNPDDYYPGPGVWDCLAVDAYQKSTTGVPVPEMDEWKRLTTWADTKQLPVIVGEWGQRGNDTISVTKLRAAYDGFIAQGVAVAAYFDTTLNGNWSLTNPMLSAFSDLLNDPRSTTLQASQ